MMPACCRKSLAALARLSMSRRLLSGRATRTIILYLPLIAGMPASFTITIHSFIQSMYSRDRNILPLPIRQRRLTDGGLERTISTTLSIHPLPIGRHSPYTGITNLATEVYVGEPDFGGRRCNEGNQRLAGGLSATGG